MNESQQRALWATALHELAESIGNGASLVPTKIEVWQQFVTPAELLNLADTFPPRALEIKDHKTFPSLKVPAGEKLDLPLEWNFQANLGSMSEHDRESVHASIAHHNAECVGR